MNTDEHGSSKVGRGRWGHRVPSALPAIVLTALLVTSCSLPLPQAQGDPTKFYVLSSPAATAAAGAAASAEAPALRLRPVEIASYLRSRPLVVRRGENELEFRDYARWGEPLDQGIARVLREELLSRGSASAVSFSGSRAGDSADVLYELNVRVLACEGLADGGVAFHAVWELQPAAGANTKPVRGEYRATDLRWTMGSEATLASALSRAVAGLSQEIGAAVRK